MNTSSRLPEGSFVHLVGTQGQKELERGSDKEVGVRFFLDPDGMGWEVVVGRESWGTVVALFLPRAGSDSVRQALLPVTSADAGTRLLSGMREEELQALLEESVVKPKESL